MAIFPPGNGVMAFQGNRAFRELGILTLDLSALVLYLPIF